MNYEFWKITKLGNILDIIFLNIVLKWYSKISRFKLLFIRINSIIQTIFKNLFILFIFKKFFLNSSVFTTCFPSNSISFKYLFICAESKNLDSNKKKLFKTVCLQTLSKYLSNILKAIFSSQKSLSKRYFKITNS